MLEVSHSSTSQARSCWMKYYWHYIEGLTPKKKSAALTLGSAVHTAFEMFYTGSTDSDVLNWIKKSYEEDSGERNSVEEEDHRINMFTALGMWAYYPYKNIQEFEEIIVEKEGKVTFGKMRNVRLVFRIDGLIKVGGVWWVREVKTTGLAMSQFMGRCTKSVQASVYVYCARKLGYDVAGVMFDVIKKPLLRRRKTETCDDFGRRIMADYAEDSKRPEDERKAFKRHYEYRSTVDMKHFDDDMEALIKDIRNKRNYSKGTGAWCRNADSCWMWNRLCPYSVICDMEKPDELTLEHYFDRREV